MRVASFPAHHPYLAAVRPAAVTAVDPTPAGAGAWDPHPWWEATTLAAAGPVVDLLHVHFGYDHLTPGQMQAWVAAAPRPYVVTVHDLRNPHHATRDRHDAHLAALLPGAAAVLTLTPGAAAEIAARFGVRARVVPHPGLTTPRPQRPGGAAVHLKSLRRNLIEPLAVVRAAAAGARDAGGTLRLDLHDDVVADPRLAGLGELDVDVHAHPRFDDEALADYLAGTHVSVLPHRFGTHSGWLEACRDLGTAVVAPSCGYYAQQWPAVHVYRHDERSGLAAKSLRHSVRTALRAPRPQPADPAWRAAQRAEVQAGHAAVYAEAVLSAPRGRITA